MTEAIIHFTGEFSADHVETTRSDAPHPVPPQVQEKIESAWIAAGRRIGPKLFDGPMIRLNSWRIEKDRLILDLGRTSYKPFMGTNLMHPELADQCGADVLANPLGLSAALESADGFLLFGRRNPDMAFYPNRIHPFAGTAETADVFAEIRKELQEEAGLLDADISELRCIGMAEDRAIRQPEADLSRSIQFAQERDRAAAESRGTRGDHCDCMSGRGNSHRDAAGGLNADRGGDVEVMECPIARLEVELPNRHLLAIIVVNVENDANSAMHAKGQRVSQISLAAFSGGGEALG